MKAAYLEQTGSPDVIQFGDVPEPVVGVGEVLIENRAVCVNPIDTYVRAGVVSMPLPLPYYPGCDAAGVVAAVGQGVKRFAIGDRVWTTNQGLLGRQGTFAEKIVVEEKWVYPLPDKVSFEDASACALVGITAHLGLFREGNLQPGQSVLAIGGTGGVGSMVVQMACAAGARVVTTAGSEHKAKLARSFGADDVILYKSESIAERAKELDSNGFDLFWETRRTPDFALAIGALRERGRMIVMAGRDATPQFPVGPFYVKECSIHGFVMFKATPIEMRAAAEDLSQWMATGKIKANIGHRLPLADAAQAHRLQESATLSDSDHLLGKIVLTV